MVSYVGMTSHVLARRPSSSEHDVQRSHPIAMRRLCQASVSPSASSSRAYTPLTSPPVFPARQSMALSGSRAQSQASVSPSASPSPAYRTTCSPGGRTGFPPRQIMVGSRAESQDSDAAPPSPAYSTICTGFPARQSMVGSRAESQASLSPPPSPAYRTTCSPASSARQSMALFCSRAESQASVSPSASTAYGRMGRTGFPARQSMVGSSAQSQEADFMSSTPLQKRIETMAAQRSARGEQNESFRKSSTASAASTLDSISLTMPTGTMRNPQSLESHSRYSTGSSSCSFQSSPRGFIKQASGFTKQASGASGASGVAPLVSDCEATDSRKIPRVSLDCSGTLEACAGAARHPIGAHVQYFSATFDKWIDAVVKGFDEPGLLNGYAGTYCLDVQPRAKPQSVRAASQAPFEKIGLACSNDDDFHDVRTAQDGPVEANEVLRRLREGNRRFLRGGITPKRFCLRKHQALATQERPMAAVIGCADSRCSVETLFDASPGDLFVLRNVGNTLKNAEDSFVGSIEYSVCNLGTGFVLVLGQTECDTILGATRMVVESTPSSYGSKSEQVWEKDNYDKSERQKPRHDKSRTALEHILAGLQPVAMQARDELAAGARLEDIAEHASYLNVFQTVEKLFKYSSLLREKAVKGELEVHGAIYDIRRGNVEFLGEHPRLASILGSQPIAKPAPIMDVRDDIDFAKSDFYTV